MTRTMNGMATHTALKVTVHGRVQGVGFRWECSMRARELGINGWVRNRADGCVEAHFEGDRPALDQMLEWVHEGPGYASVTAVDVDLVPAEGMRSFSVE